MLTEAQQGAITALLDDTMAGTEGLVEVVVDDDPTLEPDEAALEAFRARDLDDVSLLVWVALSRREVRVVAGPRLLAETDDAFWQAAADAVADGFRAGDVPEGFRRALAPVHALLLRVAPTAPNPT